MLLLHTTAMGDEAGQVEKRLAPFEGARWPGRHWAMYAG